MRSTTFGFTRCSARSRLPFLPGPPPEAGSQPRAAVPPDGGKARPAAKRPASARHRLRRLLELELELDHYGPRPSTQR